MSEKSINEMRAELEVAGYTIRNDTHEVDYKATWRVFAPDEWEYEQQGYRGKNGEQLCKEQAIQKAYAHFQREKQFQAMREYLTETYELILSRAGAEKKLSASPGVSFAACLPTANLLKLEALVDELKPDSD